MSLANDIVTEVERRLWTIKTANGFGLTVKDVRRNPKEPNTVFPCINIFEMQDVVLPNEMILRGEFLMPGYQRVLNLTIEFYVEETEQDAGTALVHHFTDMVRYVLFHTGARRDDSLADLGSANMDEARLSHIIRPPFATGKSIIGRGIDISIQYYDERDYTKIAQSTTTTTMSTTTSTTSTT